MVKGKRQSIFLAVLLVVASAAAYQLLPTSAPQFPELEEHLNTGKTAEVVKYLQSIPIADNQTNDDLINWALNYNERINAIVLFDVSRRMFVKNKHEGMKMFFVARMWVAYDGARCKDKSAKNGLALLSASAPEVLQYRRDHPEEALPAFEAAIELEKTHPSLASPLWICQRGMAGYQASVGGKSLTPSDMVISEQEWPDIRADLQKKWQAQLVQARAGIGFENVGNTQPHPQALTMPDKKGREEQGLFGSLWAFLKERASSVPNAISDKIMGKGKSYTGNGITVKHTRTFKQPCSIFTVAWSPNGRFLTGSGITCIKEIVWDIEAGASIMTTSKRFSDDGGIGFTPDSQYLITSAAVRSTSENKLARTVWDIHTGTIVEHLKGINEHPNANGFKNIKPDPDGNYIIIAGNGRKVLEILDAQTYEYVRVMGSTPANATDLAVHPEGKYAAIGERGSEGFVQVWDYTSGKLIKRFRAQTGAVESIAYSPDGKYLATGANIGAKTRDFKTMEWTLLSDPDAIRIWGAQSGELAWSYFMGEASATVRGGLAFSPDGRYLVAGIGRELHILDGHSDKVLLSITTPQLIQDLAFSPNENVLAVGGDEFISLWTVGSN